MTIASLPVISQPTVNNQSIGTAVLAKSLETVKTAGQSMIKMMEQSVAPDLGQNIDTRV